MRENYISCPCCGAQFRVITEAVQQELKLGPIEFFLPPPKKKLDKEIDGSLYSNESGRVASSSSSIANKARVESGSGLDFNSSVPETLRASCEKDLLNTVRTIIGERDWELNASLWRIRRLESPKSLAYAIEDWKLRIPDQKRAIQNRAAWLTDRYKRARKQLRNPASHKATQDSYFEAPKSEVV